LLMKAIAWHPVSWSFGEAPYVHLKSLLLNFHHHLLPWRACENSDSWASWKGWFVGLVWRRWVRFVFLKCCVVQLSLRGSY
jgi:hypothetical protein